MTTLRSTWVFVLLALLAWMPAQAIEDLPPPVVMPQPATSDQELTLTAHVSSGGRVGCDLHTPFETSLSREGTTFHLDYVIRLRGPGSPWVPCVLLPMPLPLSASLGTLEPGTYHVVIRGTSLGVANPDQQLSFTVSGDGDGGIGALPQPEVIPANPSSEDFIRLVARVPAFTNGCDLQMSSSTSVARSGYSLAVSYAYVRVDEADLPPDAICLSASVPAYAEVDLGRLPGGNYVVTINGTIDGTPAEPQQLELFVGAAPEGIKTIPTNRPLALGLLLLALAGMAIWRLRTR
ncbi:hypothetical protein OS176_00710 [Xanthomonadaceae bacterium XH05]|nr:hypothetical protein [Xanthomonadaceae bacterium XH05]